MTAVILHHTTIHLYNSVSLLNVSTCKFVTYHNSVGEINKTPCGVCAFKVIICDIFIQIHFDFALHESIDLLLQNSRCLLQ